MAAATWTVFVVALVLAARMRAVQRSKRLYAFNFGARLSYRAVDITRAMELSPKGAALVVVPVLFPLDLLFLISWGIFLALCSVTYFGALGMPSEWNWLLLLLPAIYMAADLSENILLARMLTSPDQIPALIDFAVCATRLKWVSVLLAGLQAFVALVLSFGCD